MIRDSGVPSSHSETITFGALATTRGTTICVVAGVGGGELPLRVGLEPVVQLLDHPGLELGDQRLDVHAGEQRGEQPGEPGELVEVGHQRGAGAGVLDLDRDVATVAPGRPVHLPDAGRRGRGVVELAEPLPPGAAELLGEHRVDGAHRHRRRLLLQLHQRLAVGGRDLLGHRGLEHRQRLAELHRPALELAQDGEQLLGRPLLELGGDGVGRPAGQPLAEAERGASGGPEGERRQARGPGDRAPRHHRSVVSSRVLLAGAGAPGAAPPCRLG